MLTREELAQLEMRNSGHTIGNEVGSGQRTRRPQLLFGRTRKVVRTADPDKRSAQNRVASYVPEHASVAFRGQPERHGLLVPAHRPGPDRRRRPRFREEIFGPVVAVAPFDDEADACVANNTEYGLSGSIWTESVAGPGASNRATSRSILIRRSGTGRPLAD